MALNKIILSRSGFEMSYWKITDWNIKMSQKTMEITLTPFLSSETRIDGLEPIYDEIRRIRISDVESRRDPSLSTFDYTNNFGPVALESSNLDIYKLMYLYIRKNVPEFEGATNI